MKESVWMQIIYVDVLIVTNIFINYCILLCVKKFLNCSTGYKRLILGSLFGSLFSLAAFLPDLGTLSLFFKIASGGLIVFVTFGRCKINMYIRRFFTFIFVSFGFCGIMILIYMTLKPSKMVISNDIVYFDISPLFLLVTTVVCYLIIRLIQKVTGKENAKDLVCNIDAYANGDSFKFVGKVDTCCNLTEPFSGLPVIVAEKQLFNNKIKIEQNNMRVIPFESLGGKGIIMGFKPDKVLIDKKPLHKDIYIGICEDVFKGEIKAVINSEIVTK